MLAYLKLHWKSFLYLLFIFYLSFASPSDFNSLPSFHISNIDKFVHFGMYCLLAVILIADYHNEKSTINKLLMFKIVILSIMLGGLIELIQEKWFYPRSAEWIDWMADILGTISGTIFMIFLKKIR